MQQSTRYPPDDPREWLNRARSSLRHAQARADDVYLDNLSYDTQQAAEKAIKAVLIALDVRFPYVHDLTVLLDVVESQGVRVPARVRAAAELTRYAHELGYPNRQDVDETAYVRAVAIAADVVSWATTAIRPSATGSDVIRERPATPDTFVHPERGDGSPEPGLIDDLVARIVATAAPEKVILFGSAARGTMGPHSDLDVMVIKSGSYDQREVGNAIRSALVGLGVAVDVVITTPEDLQRYGHTWALVYRPALEEGRIVYEATDS